MSFSLFDVDLSREDKEDLADQEVQSTLSEIQNEGKAVREIEHTIFARLLNFEQLKSAAHAEVQEQYIVSVDRSEENAGEGQIRVRKITDRSGNTRYEMTTKNVVKDGKVEVTIPTTEENFTQIKVLSNMSMLKHRYTFPIKGTDYKWEVDAVPDGNGGYFPWVRAEIEVKSKEDKGGEFPLKAEEVYMKAPLGEMSDEDFKEKTEPLMVKFFKRGNPFVNDGKLVETKLKSENEDTVQTDESESTDTDQDTTVEGETDEAKEARLEKDKEASLSVDNITDDKETAELVKTRGDQIKEAKGIKDDEDTEKDAESEVDGKDSDGQEEGWDTPPKDTETSKEDFVPCYRLDNGKLALESFEVQMVRPDNVNQDANVVIGEKVELSLAGDDDGYQPDQAELYHAIAPDIYPATDIALESVSIPEGDWVATFTDETLDGFTGKMPKHDVRTENLFLLEQKVSNKAVDDPRLSKLFGWLFGPKLSYFYRLKGEQAFGASLKPSIYPLPSVLNGSVAANLLKDVVPKLVESAKELDKAVKAWDDWKSLFYRKVDQLSKEFTFTERVEVARQLALLKVPGVDMGWMGAMKYVSTRTLPMNPRETKLEGIIPSTQAELNQYGHHEVGLNESMINAFRVPALDNIIQTHDFYQMAEYVAGKFRVPIMDAAVMLWHGVFNNHSYIRLFLDKEDEILTNCCYVYAMYGKTLAVIHGDAYATSINPGIINWVPLEPKLY